MRLLIYLPLTILFILAIMSMLGLGTAQFGELNIDSGKPENTIYYDINGHSACYATGEAIGEAGKIVNVQGNAMWYNNSANWWENPKGFRLYWENDATTPILFVDVGKTSPSETGINNLNLSTTLGFIVLIIGLMALAVIAGLRILGTGTSETSVQVVIMGTAYLGVWGVFSVMGLTLINSLEVIGYILYFMLTLIYTLGIVSSFSNSGEN